MNREMSMRLRDGARQVGQSPLHLAQPSRAQAAPTDTANAMFGGARERAAAHGVSADRVLDVLSHDQFVAQIEREKRRAERARAPLSLVRFGEKNEAEPDLLERAPGLVAEMKRDTDVIGYLDGNGLSVLLPHTDVEGARRFAAKVLARDDLSELTASVVTYPDHVLDSLTLVQPDGRRLDAFTNSSSTRIGVRHLIKRTMDIGGALAGIALLSPLMLMTAVAVATTSRGPVIFRQTRLGRGGKPFVLYKFRSMFRDADERVHRDYVLGLIEGGKQGGGVKRAWAKLEGDDRITFVGRFIRRTCLDELPQLFNVVKGDLSLVGPRPPLPYEAAAYEFWHLRRVLEIKPGITGLWQVEGRNIASFDDMVRMDLRYVRTWSLWLDVTILLRTAAIVLKRNGVR
jgi:lipopolysaccharide/colanic/teichoic acid biosynthesis glycosyltransferase